MLAKCQLPDQALDIDNNDPQNGNYIFSLTFLIKSFIEVELVYNIVLVSDVQWSDSVCLCVCIYTHTHIFFSHIIFHCGLSQDIEYSSFCYTRGLCCLWKWKLLSHVWLFATQNSPGQNTGVGSLSLLQGIFPIQGSNPGLAHCRWILYQLSPKGSPRILEWVAYPFSSRSSWPRN